MWPPHLELLFSAHMPSSLPLRNSYGTSHLPRSNKGKVLAGTNFEQQFKFLAGQGFADSWLFHKAMYQRLKK